MEVPTENANRSTGGIYAPAPNEAQREERPLESRGVRFRGREGRVEVRQGGPRLMRRDEVREPRDNRGDNREPREHREGRDNREHREPRESADTRRAAKKAMAARRTAKTTGDKSRLSERDIARGRQELDLPTLEDKTLSELRDVAKVLNIPSATTQKKSDLVFRFSKRRPKRSGHLFKKGILEILPDGKGFLRSTAICRATKTCMFRNRKSSDST